ncbi:MAG: putative DNA binding domain-containing protein [Erysipelotrichaceae bacterium]|nr:putative DNA binding domain-containing protein [Erysipelotrichaceae bacterium]
MNLGNENEYIEFKKTTQETEAGIISITSILNKHRRGTLYFGVKDNGDVCGLQIGKDTLRKLSRDITGNIKPNIYYEINERNSSDGLSFIEVNFSGENVPYSAYGLYYQRFSDEDRKISDIELQKLFEQRIKDYSRWEEDISDETILDIDEKFLKKIFNRGKESHRINYEYKNKKSICSKLGLLYDDDTLNNAGKYLFSKNNPITLKLATFASNTKDTFVKLNHFTGNIYECIDEAINYILAEIDWNIVINRNATRKEIPEIPEVAIREIVINAFAHGKYNSNTTFEVDIFKDRASIYSPGYFPYGYTPEDFANNDEKPIVLNPKITNVLFKTNEIESFGSGFERTFKACKEIGCTYEYCNTKSGFLFTFHRTLGHKNDQEILKMTKSEKAVFEELKNNNYITQKQISTNIGLSEKTVYRAIKSLKEKGKILRIGNDYNGKWEIQ